MSITIITDKNVKKTKSNIEKFDSIHSILKSVKIHPENVNIIEINGAKNLSEIYGLPKIITMECINCVGLRKVYDCPSLNSFMADGCPSLGVIDAPNLKDIHITGNDALTEIKNYNKLFVITLEKSAVQSMSGLPNLHKMYVHHMDMPKIDNEIKQGLIHLLIENSHNVRTLKNFNVLHSLDCDTLKKLEYISDMPLLVELSCDNCPSIKKIKNMGSISMLGMKNGNIDCIDNDARNRIDKLLLMESSIDTIENFDSLRLLRCVDMKKLKTIRNMSKLNEIRVNNCPKLDSIQNIEKLSKLFIVSCDSLTLSGLDCFGSISRIDGVPSDKTITVDNIKKLCSLKKILLARKIIKKNCGNVDFLMDMIKNNPNVFFGRRKMKKRSKRQSKKRSKRQKKSRRSKGRSKGRKKS